MIQNRVKKTSTQTIRHYKEVLEIYYNKVKELEKQVSEQNAKIKQLEEVISYLPKVPTQPYEKELVQKIRELEERNKELINLMDKLFKDIKCTLLNVL